MGLFRVILLGVIVWLVISMMKRYQANSEARRKKVSNKESGQEKVLQCKTCGIYVPENEAIRDGENTYCSNEHQIADQSDTEK